MTDLAVDELMGRHSYFGATTSTAVRRQHTWRRAVRRVALALVLGLVTAASVSPDLRSLGSGEALALSNADGVYTGGTTCEKDEQYQTNYFWWLLTRVDDKYDRDEYESHKGGCVEKPRTTRPGDKDWDRYYEPDYDYVRNQHKDQGWWGW